LEVKREEEKREGKVDDGYSRVVYSEFYFRNNNGEL
jgi:hypothetical protein